MKTFPRGTFILHVEDNPDDVALTAIAFKGIHFPHKIVVASDGAQALDFLFAAGAYAGRDKRDTPAIVLLDLNLPKVHGLEVLRRMKADPILKRVIVVIFTSSREETDLLNARRLDTAHYLNKPGTAAEFDGLTRLIGDLLTASAK